MQPLAKADAHTGAMVALYPPPELAAQLAAPGGEPAEELHVTLAYLGPAANIEEPERLKQAVAKWAAEQAPIDGHFSGHGQFTSGPVPVTYATVDLPTLAPAREKLVFSIVDGVWDVEPSREHGFAPHLTLAYDARTVSVPNLPVTFDTVTLKLGDERTDFPLYGTRAEWIVPLWKADDLAADAPPDQRIVYGVVLHPGVTDSQGDVVSAEEIEKAAHDYLVASRLLDVQHNETAAPVDVVESYIAPAALEVAGRPVLKGAWIMGVRVNDDDIWSRVQKRELTGFSIGGTGVRT